MTSNCSIADCPCAGKPRLRVGTPDYATRRYHVDAGDLEALRIMMSWMADGQPFLHLRWADGEFNSILNQPGVNGDDAPFQGDTLGAELRRILKATRDMPKRKTSLLYGIDWTGPAARFEYVRKNNLLRTIPWCPSQVFVNGIVTDDTMRFLELVRDWPGRVLLVANDAIMRVAPALKARPVLVPHRNAFDACPRIREELQQRLQPGDLVLYAAGMTSNVLGWSLFQRFPDTTHIDVGCLFDGAAGFVSRSWLQYENPRRSRYREVYVPWLLSEKS